MYVFSCHHHVSFNQLLYILPGRRLDESLVGQREAVSSTCDNITDGNGDDAEKGLAARTDVAGGRFWARNFRKKTTVVVYALLVIAYFVYFTLALVRLNIICYRAGHSTSTVFYTLPWGD